LKQSRIEEQIEAREELQNSLKLSRIVEQTEEEKNCRIA
jgi:hypothetical protein